MWDRQPHLHGRAICEFDPHVQIFHIHLLSKTLVSNKIMVSSPWNQIRGPPQHYLDVLNPMDSIVHRSEKHPSFYRTLNPTSYGISRTPVESLPRAQNGNCASKRTFGGLCKLVQACIMWECQPHLTVEQYANLTPMCRNWTFTQ